MWECCEECSVVKEMTPTALYVELHNHYAYSNTDLSNRFRSEDIGRDVGLLFCNHGGKGCCFPHLYSSGCFLSSKHQNCVVTDIFR